MWFVAITMDATVYTLGTHTLGVRCCRIDQYLGSPYTAYPFEWIWTDIEVCSNPVEVPTCTHTRR